MTLEEAIKTALEYEYKIRDIYLEGVQAIEDAAGKRIFQELADDEQRHVDYLEYKLDEWQQTGKITPQKLESTVPSRSVIRKEAAKIRLQMKRDDRGVKQQMLSKALKMEIETSNFYRELVDRLTEKGRQMFARFLEIEDNHIEAVQFELDHVSHSGYWFGFEEFDMEEG
jgi:rubrerythrin